MNRLILTLGTLALSGLALAAPFSVQGAIKAQGTPASNLRVGLMLDRSGRAGGEVASVAVSGAGFSLNVPEVTPPANWVQGLSPEALDWPGLIGKVSLTGSAKVAQAALRAYVDADGSKSFTAGDTPLESFVTRGRGGIVTVWSDARVRIQADRGFDLTLEPGWNLVVIELGKTVDAKRAGGVEGVQLEIFGR